jgi:erythromycin esterase
MTTRSEQPDQFSQWLRDHATRLSTTDPAAPLDDLEPLRDLIAGARVVAIGENAHFIREFIALRHRLLRFLVERCGYTVFALEFGFSEGFGVDDWLQGNVASELDDHTEAAIAHGTQDALHWLRDHNRMTDQPVRFAGIDLPAAAGSLLPALSHVVDYLTEVDTQTLPLARAAWDIAERYGDTSMVKAAAKWAAVNPADRDALTATLARLLTRFRAVEPMYVERAGQPSYDRALRRVEAACHTDYTFHAMEAMFAGTGITADTSAREVFMAGSVLWHLEHAGPDAKIALMAHNAHIHKAPISFNGVLAAFPMGQHLSRALGDDYRALALTGIGGRTADMQLNPQARFGFDVVDTALESSPPDSVEAAFAAAEIEFGLAGWRGLTPPEGPGHIRMQATQLTTPVCDAFDGVLCVPSTTVADDVP